MPSNDRAEFLAELAATDESYVRRKLTLGGYTGWREKTVERWLAQRAQARMEELAMVQLSVTRVSGFWNRARAIATLVGVAITAAWRWWPKS